MTTKNLHGDLLDTLVSVSEFLDNYVDVVDGDYGEPRPNSAMSLKGEVDRSIERLERDIKALAEARPRTEAEKLSVIKKAIIEGSDHDLDFDTIARTVLYALEERL